MSNKDNEVTKTDKPVIEDPRDAEVRALRAMVEKMQANTLVSTGAANPVIARTCNSCGKKLSTDENTCPTHPGEYVNHMAMGLDPETGLRREALKHQTRS